jgi:hypothetical protein
MFSVSETTLGILSELRKKSDLRQLKLYAIVPYTFEYVRIATQTGTPGLAKRLAKQIAFSGDLAAAANGLRAVATGKPSSILSTYLAYEASRVKSAIGGKARLVSLFLHEVVTDMCLALDFDWLFRNHIEYCQKREITPGFHTRNFPYLLKKLEAWDINVDDTLITTPFNRIGFQMNPSKEDCENALSTLNKPLVLAISVLASGFIKPPEAAQYVTNLKNIKGITVGVSSPEQAQTTFSIFQNAT